MNTRGSDRALVALLAGFGLLVLACIGAVWLTGEQQRSAGWVNHSLEVENRIARVLSLLQDAETGQRGYLLTRRPEFLSPYEDAAPKLPAALDELGRATADNPVQKALLVRLDRVARARAVLLADILRSAPSSGPFRVAEVEKLQRGKQLMDEARALVTQMRAYEEALLAERERMQGQLRQMQKMEAVGQLTGGVAHDFNNMLAVIIGSLDIARRRLTGSEDTRARAAIDNALEGASTAAQLTSRLLAFSRQQALQPQPLDANKLVAGMSELVRRTVLENVKVESVLAGGLWRTSADPNQLESAILNLCINARDAMPSGGRLTIETGNASLDEAYAAGEVDLRPGQYVMIGVTDTGDGMTADVLERAFDPFYTTKGVGKGTGLGLSQVYGFVKQSGGHVKIYSELGRGTTVKIYLPRLMAAGALPEIASSPESGPPRGNADEVVLVVEDEARVREMSTEALRELGYTVIHASGAAEALERLAEEPRIGLLFTDVVMPDVDGRKLAEQARESRPDLKVLFTTGFTRNAVVHNGVLDAGVAFLPKPFTVEQLARKVRAALDGEP